MRPELLERYNALPLPTTKDEAWRFTDLKGFDPDSFSADGATEIADRAGAARAGGGRGRARLGGRAGDRARAGGDPLRAARRPPAARRARRRRREVRCPQRGDVGARPARPRPAGLRARAAAVHPDRERPRRRLALLAASDRGRAGEPLHRDRGVRVDLARGRRLRERRGRDLRRPGGQGRVRVRPERLPRDLALRDAPRTGRAGRRARLGRRRLRLQEGQGPDPERPRRAAAPPRA